MRITVKCYCFRWKVDQRFLDCDTWLGSELSIVFPLFGTAGRIVLLHPNPGNSENSAMLALLARIFQNLADPKQQHSLANRKILGKTGTFQSNSSGMPMRRSWSHYTLHCLDLQECFRHFHINVENVRLIMQDHFSNDKVRLNEFERFKVWSLVSLTSKSLRIQEVLLRNPR